MNLRSSLVRLGAAAALAATFALVGCNSNIRSGGETTVEVPEHYDMTIEPAKDNQFVLDGAILSASDLESHFRYLQEEKQLPKTVLLKDGEKERVKNPDLQEFASLQLTFHFTGYVLHKGKLTLMSAVAAKGKSGSSDSDQPQQHERHHHEGGGFGGGFGNGGGMGNGVPTQG